MIQFLDDVGNHAKCSELLHVKFARVAEWWGAVSMDRMPMDPSHKFYYVTFLLRHRSYIQKHAFPALTQPSSFG